MPAYFHVLLPRRSFPAAPWSRALLTRFACREACLLRAVAIGALLLPTQTCTPWACVASLACFGSGTQTHFPTACTGSHSEKVGPSFGRDTHPPPHLHEIARVCVAKQKQWATQVQGLRRTNKHSSSSGHFCRTAHLLRKKCLFTLRPPLTT